MKTLLFASEQNCASLLLVFCLGACAAAFANYCVDVFGWTPRYRSPWRRFPREFAVTTPRPRLSFVPIVGWLALARIASRTGDKSYSTIPGWEANVFWLRPFLTEILFALLATWRFQALCGGFPATLQVCQSWLVEFVFYWILLCAAFVDLDDFVIPDSFTIPGAILGLLFAATLPYALILTPTAFPLDLSAETSTYSVGDWFNAQLARGGNVPSSSVNLAIFGVWALIWSLWSFALLDRRFYLRFGLRKAFAVFFRRLRRSKLTPIVSVLWIVGLVALYFAATKLWPYSPKVARETSPADFLTCSFLGLFVGMVMIWAVRVIGGASLGVEAMGFGDVIFSGVIGAFVGWQGVIVVFFAAPFFGLVFGVLRRLFERTSQIPYGPFLALAAVVYSVFRDSINEAAAPWFNDPVFLLIIGGIGFFMLGCLLLILRGIKILLGKEKKSA